MDKEIVLKKMETHQLTASEIAKMSGIDRAQISNWLSGKRNLSKVAKAFFHYFFLHVESHR
jgi:transcriptional regulator with XRE-family HTH domain